MTQLWLAFLLLFAPAPSDAGEPVSVPAGLIVHVVDMNGQAISGAVVHAGMKSEESGGPESPAWKETTPTEGRVRLTGLPVDEIVWLLVERKGFFPELRNVKLESGGRREVKVALRAGGVAVGRVVDEAGRPVAGAEVEIEGSPFDLWTEKLPAFVRDLGTQRARTGPAGRFRIHDLPEGEFELTIRHPSFVPFQGDRPIRGGRSGNLGRFVLRRGEALRGLVTDPEGRPIAGLPLWAVTAQMEQEEIPPPSATTGPDGTFEIPHLPPGELELLACGPDYVQQSVTVRFLDEPVLLTLMPAATLRGQVLGPEGRPQEGVSVFAQQIPAFSPGVLSPRSLRLFCGWNSSANTDAEGRFEIGPLAPGWYDLGAQADGLQPGLVAKLRAPAGEPVEGIELRLQRETGEKDAAADKESELLPVRGRVVGPDGAPVERAQVLADPGMAWSLADGSFDLRLSLRDTVLTASKPGFAQFQEQIDPAEASASGIVIRLEPGATVDGRVLGLTDEERERPATISLSGSGRSLYAVLRSDATFQIRDVPPGTWDVAVWTSRRVAETTLVVQPGQSEVSLDVELAEAYTVTGEVLDELGGPVGGADLGIWGGHPEIQAGTRANGRFALLLADGDFQITVEKKGFHSAGLKLQVDGGPVDGLEVRLVPSATLRGRLFGLAPGEMPWIAARGSTNGLPGVVELDRYSVSDLGPGTWTIEATLRNEGSEQRVVRRTIEIPPGAEEIELDLDFATTEVKP
ncbi:MAG TPA: carboxypeptidase-like regulatory domain-containing protein [Thermoanaerobaculia bacterium]|nr:carboxypeptidase-like regulatory domain-containing protein [Thermoanaerobaculia bacterium]